MFKKWWLKGTVLMFVFFGIGIGCGQNKKLVDLWGFPEYDDDIFDTSFIDEQLKKNLLSNEFTPYFFANENDWKDVLESTYDENGIVIRKSDSVYFRIISQFIKGRRTL